MVKHKVLVLDPVSQDGIEELIAHDDFIVSRQEGLSEAQIIDIISDFEAVIVRSQTTMTKRIIQHAQKLKVIARAGVGVDNIDIDAATRHGIIVINAPEGNTISATEHTMAMLLTMARDIPEAYKELTSGIWNRGAHKGVELQGKTLGIIGAGKIGFGVARRAKSFGMKIVAFDPYLSDEKANDNEIEKMEVDELAAVADFVTVHTPLTPQTKSLINKDFFSKVKDTGIYVINVARGGIVDEDDLLEALEAGIVNGAALDVFVTEPPDNTALIEHRRTVVTPHLGASTVEAQEKVAVSVSKEIIEYFLDNKITHAVNAPRISSSVTEELRPYLSVVRHLGQFGIQLLDAPPHEVKIKYYGDLAVDDTSILTRTFVKHVLEPHFADEVNIINALYYLKELGVTYNVEKNPKADGYTNYLEVELINDKEHVTIGSSSIPGYGERLVKLNQYPIDFKPESHILIIEHTDRPGIIGELGALLGEDLVNIASMQLARQVREGDAMVLFTLDNQVPVKTLEKIKDIKNIHQVHTIILD
ncbi:phosphoglycerate dehydrogenase [Jeotgalicoccus huakuii]|nr:phosphoglycerate dehydrogenase [Jeotgalicoccus huakuii]